jgi:hypothetical protein
VWIGKERPANRVGTPREQYQRQVPAVESLPGGLCRHKQEDRHMEWLKKGVVIGFAFSALTAAGVVAAQQSEQQPGGAAGQPSFSELDKDGNGYLDENEVQAVPGIQMDSADTDGDKQLSQTEFESAMQAGGGGAGGGGSGGGGTGGGSQQ